MVEESSQLTDFDDRFEDPSEDPLFNFDEGDPAHTNVFKRKELLKVGHVPESTRIVGRDEEIERWLPNSVPSFRANRRTTR